jgi:hypothetical protein
VSLLDFAFGDEKSGRFRDEPDECQLQERRCGLEDGGDSPTPYDARVRTPRRDDGQGGDVQLLPS